MKVQHRKGIANHPGPESCGGAREGAIEALTGEGAGQPLSREIRATGAPTLLSEAEGRIGEGATREPSTSPTRSKTLSMRRSSPNRNCEISSVPAVQYVAGGSGKASGRTPDIYAGEKSDACVVCAGQRVVQEGSSPSGARMRGVISERGGNASRAGEREKEGMEKPTRARKRKLETDKADLQPPTRQYPGGQGVRREVESEGHEEKYRVVVDGAIRRRSGRPKVGQGRACTMEAKAFSFTHRTKVFAHDTVRKNDA